MRMIKLTKGKFALVDDSDFERLSKYKWHMHLGYALRASYSSGKKKHIRMHRDILNVPSGKYADHINRNGLDNRRCNLRICSIGENNRNKIKKSGTSSIFKGVSWNKKDEYWHAYIYKNYKRYFLGLFEKETNAAKVYNKKAKELFGKFALLNKIKGTGRRIE